MPTIDALTYVITIPKSETAFVGTDAATGREIRTIDTNVLRLAVAALLDDEIHVLMPDAYTHNTEVDIDGVIYARTIKWIAPYTFTFEDGNYAVGFTGSNTNLGSVTNVNSVSVRPANSAGLQTVTVGSGVLPSDVVEIANKTRDTILRTSTATGAGAVQEYDPDAS